MISNSKISFKFVVQTRSYYGANITDVTETKSKGRRTGASPPVSLMLRMGVVCSDLPPLFNQNHLFMQTTNDKCGTCADRPLTAESIIKELIGHAPMEMFEESLHNLFLTFVNQDGDLVDGEFKDNVVYTYTCLRDLIKNVDKLQKLQKS